MPGYVSDVTPVPSPESSWLVPFFVAGERPRRGSVWTALLVSALLGVASVLVPVSRPAVAVQAGVMEKGPELQRPDVVSAGVTARAAGQRVEITGHRTEFSRSYMNTDGSISVSEHAGQQRFKNSAGGWVEVDLDLAVGEDGVVAPKAHPLDLRVAGGGEKDAALVSVTAGIDTQGSDRRISWTWPGVLPTPVLDGSTATYEDVTPGVDMRVVATRSGFEQFFEMKCPRFSAALIRVAALG